METKPEAPSAPGPARPSPLSALLVLAFSLASLAPLRGQSRLPLECVSTWTAFNWIGSGWKETVVAKTVAEKYSPEGLLLSSETGFLVGGVAERVEYLYSGARLVKATARDGSGALLRSTSYSYSESGGLLERRALTLAADGSRANESLEFFGPGGTLDGASVLAADGSVISIIGYKYDSRGRLSDEYASAADNSLVWARGCEYGAEDSAGNWLERTDWESFRGSWPHQRYAVRRRIVYAGEAAK
jgi:hypothetical protein